MLFSVWINIDFRVLDVFFKYKHVRSCNVLRVCFWEHVYWVFQLRDSSGARSPWRSAEIMKFEMSENLMIVNINLHFWRLIACTQTLFYFSFRSFRKHRRACENERGARERKVKNVRRHLWGKRGLLSPSPMSTPYHYHLRVRSTN